MKARVSLLSLGIFVAISINGLGQPVITQQPVDRSVSLDASATLQVTATTVSPPILYQWRFAGADISAAVSFRLTLTDIQLVHAGEYRVVVTDSTGSATSRVARLDVDPAFTKITTGDLVCDPGSGMGCAWGDYDEDGFLDLFLTTAPDASGRPRKNVLFHNNRDGTFSKVTNTVLTVEARSWRGCTWVDYDNDGLLDLFVTSTDASGFAAENELFRNKGDGSFEKMTKSAIGDIASTASGNSEFPVWADYDNDGFADVFIARYGTDWLFHNDRGFFRSVPDIVSGSTRDDSYCAAWGDYNNDGQPDLFVAVKSDPPINRLYLNGGGGTFTDITSGAIATDRIHSFGPAWGDYDNDGFLDLFVAASSYVASRKNLFYHNEGNGTFTRITDNAVGSIVTDTARFVACAWGDYDNDGFLDLFATDYGDGSTIRTNYLYHSNGDGSFRRVLTGSTVNDHAVNSGACTWADYDNDGFLEWGQM